MTATTPPKLMAIRFMIFEMCMFVGMHSFFSNFKNQNLSKGLNK
jgi:hypothetical protein